MAVGFHPYPGYDPRGNYQEQGYSFEHPYLWHQQDTRLGNPNDGVLVRANDGGTTFIRRIDGSPFTPISLQLAEWGWHVAPSTLTLIGTYADGSTVSASYGMSSAWVDYQFGLTFANVVSIQTDARMILMDNFTASAIPEPGTGVLCFLGIAALCTLKRKLRDPAS